MSKKRVKYYHFWAKCVSLRPAEPAACSVLIFCGMLVLDFVMMHAILEFCKDSKWLIYIVFCNISKNIHFCS